MYILASQLKHRALYSQKTMYQIFFMQEVLLKIVSVEIKDVVQHLLQYYVIAPSVKTLVIHHTLMTKYFAY